MQTPHHPWRSISDALVELYEAFFAAQECLEEGKGWFAGVLQGLEKPDRVDSGALAEVHRTRP